MALLALGAAGLSVGALRIDEIPTRTYVCERVPGPNGWAIAGLVLFALVVIPVGYLGAWLTNAHLTVRSVYFALALGEGVGAIVLAAWLNAKYSRYYCG